MLERMFIQHGSEQKPSPDYDGGYDDVQGDTHQSQRNYLVHRYVDSLINSSLYHSEGGAESFDQWVRRGPYYRFQWPKDATEHSSRATATFKFSQPFADGQQPLVLLFSQWRTALKIKHGDGRITMKNKKKFLCKFSKRSNYMLIC